MKMSALGLWCAVGFSLAARPMNAGQTAVDITPTPTLGTPTATPTSCGVSIPLVAPVTSPTTLLQQTISGSARLTGARYLSISSEAGGFGCYSPGASCGGSSFAVPITLAPGQTNHIAVCDENLLCGGSACTQVDVNGQPLEIVQIFVTPTATATATPTPTGPTPTATATPTPSPTRTPAAGVYAYVTDRDQRIVHVINAATDAETIAINVDCIPLDLAVGAGGRRVFATCVSGGELLAIDAAFNTPLASIPLTEASAGAIAANPNDPIAYVVHPDTDHLAVVDTDNATVAGTIEVGHQPCDVAVTPDGLLALVSNAGANSVSIVDTVAKTSGPPITLSSYPTALAVASDGGHAYVVTAADELVVIDLASRAIAGSIPVPTSKTCGPNSVAVSPDGAAVYVVDSQYPASRVAIIDVASGSVVTMLTVGTESAGVAFAPDGKKAYVGNMGFYAGEGSISVVDVTAKTVSKAIPFGLASPFNVAFANIPGISTPGPSPTPPPTLALPCVGDCDGSGDVTVSEIIALVDIALGGAQSSACANGIPGGAEVDVALIIQAVNSALTTCGIG